MDKLNKTYQTPGGALRGLPELPGALWYGRTRGGADHEWHEVAVIEEDGDEVLCAGPTYFAWKRRSEVERDGPS